MNGGVGTWGHIKFLTVYEWKNAHRKMKTKSLYPKCPTSDIPTCFYFGENKRLKSYVVNLRKS